MKASIIRECYSEAMEEFAAGLKAADLSDLRVPPVANPKKGKSSGISRKGGSPPIEYTAIEMLVDMKIALRDHEWKDAYTLYIQLKRITNR